ncbi:hypothetical protein HC026_09755 [Lactobacillus sp. LC28-10]|uniref:Integral membrane protein n=1 Tax=Secundilactobacillus angelensis TaxID=2722706 RepID=A0ABX1KZ26_9LACO|nr:hypothetical protein [Secundilactobacillus angelensis]MCH5463268.1 hypothetical protein [Secundilactobacillus angelensis]NLR19196.1 hypothetical protein [Secundilactobacillus angelensis]
MLEKIEAFIVHHRRLIQGLFFGFIEMSGLLLYANANSFQSYTQPQQLPLLVLALTTILIFISLYVLKTTSSASKTAPIVLLLTIAFIILSIFKLPTFVNIINGLAIVVLLLIRYLPKWFNNELGIMLLSLILSSLAAGNFLLTHNYLSTAYLTTMILPFLLFMYFFLPQKAFHLILLPIGLIILILAWLLFSHLTVSVIMLSVIVLLIWLGVQTIRQPSPSRGLLIAALLQTIILVISR